MWALNKKEILEEIKQEIELAFKDYEVKVTLSNQEVDVATNSRIPVVDLNISQFEGEYGVGGLKRFYRNKVSFHILNPYANSHEYYDYEEGEMDSQMDRRMFPEKLWEYFQLESRYINFDIIDLTMIELIHRYPKQSDVYRFEMNIVTSN